MQRDVRLLPLNMIRRERRACSVADDLLELLRLGRLRLPVSTFPLREIVRALEALGSGAVRGRVAVEP
jgi:NADPH2:quinone reductase